MKVINCVRFVSFAVLMIFAVDRASLRADVLEYSRSGSTTNTQGSFVGLNVVNPLGVVVDDFQHLGRGDGVVRNFELFFRQGSFDETIDVDGDSLPAYQVESVWSRISLIEDVSLDSNSLLSFTLNQNEGANGTLTLDPGFYSFLFHSTLSPNGSGSSNGIRTSTVPDGESGMLLAFDENMELFSQMARSGSAFGTNTPNFDRVPSGLSISYTAIPEPSSALISGIIFLGLALRRRVK